MCLGALVQAWLYILNFSLLSVIIGFVIIYAVYSIINTSVVYVIKILLVEHPL